MVVSTHLKNISEIGSFPNINNIWNHHLVMHKLWHSMIFPQTFLLIPIAHHKKKQLHLCEHDQHKNTHEQPAPPWCVKYLTRPSRCAPTSTKRPKLPMSRIMPVNRWPTFNDRTGTSAIKWRHGRHGRQEWNTVCWVLHPENQFGMIEHLWNWMYLTHTNYISQVS